jgi:peptide/nickel transport system ATP-binding protein
VGDGRTAACFRTDDDHAYWDSEPIGENAPEEPADD